jgi:hypothetical protein
MAGANPAMPKKAVARAGKRRIFRHGVLLTAYACGLAGLAILK